jgi:citrate lyase subunit gamma (acyl carrier protein)
MEIKGMGMAGTQESSDITVYIEKGSGKGVEIELKSTVENQFGEQIRKVIKETLNELGINDARIRAVDKGALDCTIRARLLTAVGRATDNVVCKWEAK